MSQVDPAKIIHDTVIFVRNFLRDNLTDPATNRPTGSKFVLTQYPTRDVYYPHVIVYHLDAPGDPIGGNSAMYKHLVRIVIDVLTLSAPKGGGIAQCVSITDEILAQIKANKQQFINYGLYRLRFPVARHNPLPDVENLHRKTIELEFKVYT